MATTGNQAVTSNTTYAPSTTTVTNYRTFVAASAPNIAAAVDNCLAVTGWSVGLSWMGGEAGSLTGGRNKAEFVEQCAAVKKSIELFDRAVLTDDMQLKALSLNLLLHALPNYGPAAMKDTVDKVNAYVEKNGDEEPGSVVQIFGAKAFKPKTRVAPPPAPAPAPLVVIGDITATGTGTGSADAKADAKGGTTRVTTAAPAPAAPASAPAKAPAAPAQQRAAAPATPAAAAKAEAVGVGIAVTPKGPGM